MARITISAAAKRGFASRPTLYRAIKDGRLTAVQDGDKKTLDLADRVKVFGEPEGRPAPGKAPAPKPDLAAAVQAGHLEADRDRLAEEVGRLRRERDQARREAGEERDQARQERDRLLGLVEATQKLLEDQSRGRKRGWWRLFGKGSVAGLVVAVLLIGGTSTDAAHRRSGEWAERLTFYSAVLNCVFWSEARIEDSGARLKPVGKLRISLVQWLHGYLTAYRTWGEKRSGPVDNANLYGAVGWMDSYCKDNGKDDLAKAAEQFILAIKTKSDL